MSEKLNQWVLVEYQKRGWTMSELARRGGVSSSFVSNVLAGKREPGPKFYQAIARAFDVTLESVEELNANGHPPTSHSDNPTIKDLVEIAKRLPPEEQAELREYALFRLRRLKEKPPKSP